MAQRETFAEFFVSDHSQALRRASELARGAVPAAGSIRIPGVSDFEVDELLGLAAAAVHERGEVALDAADLSADELFVVPDAGVRVLEELPVFRDDNEDPVLPSVAEEWTEQEDVAFDGAAAAGILKDVAALAASVSGTRRLYVWAVPVSVGL